MFDAYLVGESDRATSARVLLWLMVAALVGLIAWSSVALLDEVAVGPGKVTPSSRGKTIQSPDPGVLVELLVREGDIVVAGQKLVTLDPAQAQSSVEEAEASVVVLQAKAARLLAEMNGSSRVEFPPELPPDSDAIKRENELFVANRRAFAENVANLRRELNLAQQEVAIARPLLSSGAANEVEVLRLQQKVAELATRLSAVQGEYHVGLKTEYTKTMAELEPLLKVREGRADQLRRTVITSPARGVVKDIRISTIGGVVGPGGVLMEIVPLDDQLLIEARLSPRDIAFIHPGQPATVKITAYDSSIYGTLPGKVERISPDTLEDEVDRRVHYFRVYVRTAHSYLETADHKRHPILPGMISSTEIRTGRKTVLDYLLKPLRKAGEALRER